MKCKHENVFVARGHKVTYAKGVKRRVAGFGLRDQAIVEVRICRGGVDGKECGAWLSLGPSTDTGEHAEAVSVEIRAAVLSHTAFSLLIDCENCGWEAHDDDDDDHDRDCQYPWPERDDFNAGYLARAIATHHDEEQS